MADTPRPWTKPASGAEGEARAGPALTLDPVLRLAIGLAVACLAGAWIGYYLITPLPFIAVETFPATVRLHFVTGLIVIPYLVSLVLRRRLPGGTLLDGALLLLLGVYLLATVTSLDWRLSLEVTMTALMAIAVFYVLSDDGLFRRWQIETALMLAVLALAFYGLWKVAGDYADWLRLSEAVTGSRDWIPPTVPKIHNAGDHPNLLGGIMAMTLPFFLVGTLRRRPAPLRVAFGAGALVLLLAAFFSLARSAWVGAFVGAGVTALLVAALTPTGLTLLRRVWPDSVAGRWATSAVAMALVALLVGGFLFAFQAVEARPLWLFRPSGEPRVDAMSAGAEMVQDNLLLGTGPGVYSLLYPEYSGKNPNHAFHSHNGFLQTGVDMGLAGGLAMVVLAGTAGWLIIEGLRKADADSRLSIIACASGLVAFGTFSLLDAPNGFKGPLIALASVGAVLALAYREGVPRDEPMALTPDSETTFRPRHALMIAARVIVPVAAAGMLVVWARLDAAQYYYDASIAPQREERWAAAIEDAERAVELDGDFAPYRLQLGAIEGGAYLDTGDPALLDDAIAELQRAVEIEPRSAIGHANLARLLAERNDRPEARTAAEAALEFANSDLAVVLSAGVALEQANWGDEAVRAYSRALFLDAGLADSPFWEGSAFRQDRFPDILGQSVLVLNPCLMLRLYSEGVPAIPISRADALVTCADSVNAKGASGDKATLAAALIEDGDLENARGLLDNVLEREPDFGLARTVLGRWYAAQGRIDDARSEWVRAGELGEVEALVLLGNSYLPAVVPPEVIDKLRGEIDQAASQVQFHLTGILYYRFKFLRGSPNVTLLPGDWEEGVPGRYADARNALERWTGGS